MDLKFALPAIGNEMNMIVENVAQSATYLNYWFNCLYDEAKRVYGDTIVITLEPIYGYKVSDEVCVKIKMKDIQII